MQCRRATTRTCTLYTSSYNHGITGCKPLPYVRYVCFVDLQGLVYIWEIKLGTFGALRTAFEGLPFSSLRSSEGESWEGAGSWCVCGESDRV